MSDQTMTEAALRFPPQPGDVIADTVARSNRMAFRAGADWQASRPTPPSGLDRATIEACAAKAGDVALQHYRAATALYKDGKVPDGDPHTSAARGAEQAFTAIRALAEPEPRNDGGESGDNVGRAMAKLTDEQKDNLLGDGDAPTPPEPGSERAGGYTDADLDAAEKAAEEAVYRRHERGFLMKPLMDPLDMRKAIVAALNALRQRRAAEAEPVAPSAIKRAFFEGFICEALNNGDSEPTAQKRAADLWPHSQAAADYATPPAAEPTDAQVEAGWLLERADSDPAEPWYWAAGQIDPSRSSAWTQNHMAAIRFARKEDADAVATRLMAKVPLEVRVCNHEWVTANGQ